MNVQQQRRLDIYLPRRGQKKYNKAEDYEIKNVFKASDSYSKSKESYLNRMESIKKPPATYICPNCGKKVSKKDKLCLSCTALKYRKVERPNRNYLKTLIRTKPFFKIGKQFGVTDNAIRKWCRFYNLPYLKKEINKYSDEEWKNI